VVQEIKLFVHYKNTSVKYILCVYVQYLCQELCTLVVCCCASEHTSGNFTGWFSVDSEGHWLLHAIVLKTSYIEIFTCYYGLSCLQKLLHVCMIDSK